MLDHLADRLVAREQTFGEHPARNSAVVAFEGTARVIDRVEQRLIGASVGNLDLEAHRLSPEEQVRVSAAERPPPGERLLPVMAVPLPRRGPRHPARSDG